MPPARLNSETLHSGTNSLKSKSSTRGSSPRRSHTDVSRDTVKEVEFMVPPSRDPKLPCFWLHGRKRNPGFIGRQDILKQIDDVLLSPEVGQLRSFAICGMGGIDKTELAIEYAHSRRNRFDAIFWLSGENSEVLASHFSNLAVELGLEDVNEQPKWPKDETQACSREIVMNWLAQPLKNQDLDTKTTEKAHNLANWLIIFDNVENVDVLYDHWPEFGQGSVLITSRDTTVPNTIRSGSGPLYAPQLKTINLTRESRDWKENEAVEMLAQCVL